MNKTKQHSGKELAEANVFPSQLSSSEKRKGENEFSRFRIQRIKNMSNEERLYSKLLQLKYLMEDYANSNEYNNHYTFSYFLNEYLHSLNINKTNFSKEISLHGAQLSRLLNNIDKPNEKILVRLEIHSNNIIPATYWYRIVDKQKEAELLSNRAIRKEESKNVTNNLAYLFLFLIIILLIYKSQESLVEKNEIVMSKINPISNATFSFINYSRSIFGFLLNRETYQFA